MAKKSKRRQIKKAAVVQKRQQRDEVEELQTQLTSLSLGSDCNHGLSLDARYELAVFLEFFLAKCVQVEMNKKDDEKVVRPVLRSFAVLFGLLPDGGHLTMISRRRRRIVCLRFSHVSLYNFIL